MNRTQQFELIEMGRLCADAELRRARRCEVHKTAHVGPGVRLGCDVRVGPMATVVDATPGGVDAPTELMDGVVVGPNATVAAGCRVGLRASIAAGAVVSRSVPPLAIVEGNPGRITGYVDSTHAAGKGAPAAAGVPGSFDCRVRGVKVTELRTIPDMRGTLSPGDFMRDVPFEAKRFFFVYGVPSFETRGEHAHFACEQFLVAASGSVRVLVDDGNNREEFHLDRASLGVYIPPLVWGVQYRYTADAVLLVFASHSYCAEDYIRDYSTFLAVVRGGEPKGGSPAATRRGPRLMPLEPGLAARRQDLM